MTHQQQLDALWDEYKRHEVRVGDTIQVRIPLAFKPQTDEDFSEMVRKMRHGHLEPVTQRVNLLRGETMVARQAAQTHCKRGHSFDAANTQRSGGHRACKACANWRRRKTHSDYREQVVNA